MKLRAVAKDGRILSVAARQLSRRDFSALRQWLEESGSRVLLVCADGAYRSADMDAPGEPIVLQDWASWKRGIRSIGGAD